MAGRVNRMDHPVTDARDESEPGAFPPVEPASHGQSGPESAVANPKGVDSAAEAPEARWLVTQGRRSVRPSAGMLPRLREQSPIAVACEAIR